MSFGECQVRKRNDSISHTYEASMPRKEKCKILNTVLIVIEEIRMTFEMFLTDRKNSTIPVLQLVK